MDTVKLFTVLLICASLMLITEAQVSADGWMMFTAGRAGSRALAPPQQQLLIEMPFQLTFTPAWGKRSQGAMGINPLGSTFGQDACKTPVDSLLVIYRMIQVGLVNGWAYPVSEPKRTIAWYKPCTKCI